MVEGDDGQRFFRLGLGVETDRAAIAGNPAALQSLAYVVVRNDGCLLLEVRIASGVIVVVMRVDDKPHRLVGDAFERGPNFLRQRSVLVVDHHDSVIAYQCADVARVCGFQHVDVASHFGDLHLNFAEVHILCRGQTTGEAGKQDRWFAHERVPSSASDYCPFQVGRLDESVLDPR
jgi:hypothetical protein